MEFYPPEKLRSVDPVLAGRAGSGHLAPADNTHIAEYDWTNVARRDTTTCLVGSVRGVVANCDKSGSS
jgi:hypothetical protein